jgi:hypothetical protein
MKGLRLITSKRILLIFGSAGRMARWSPGTHCSGRCAVETLIVPSFCAARGLSTSSLCPRIDGLASPLDLCWFQCHRVPPQSDTEWRSRRQSDEKSSRSQPTQIWPYSWVRKALSIEVSSSALPLSDGLQAIHIFFIIFPTILLLASLIFHTYCMSSPSISDIFDTFLPWNTRYPSEISPNTWRRDATRTLSLMKNPYFLSYIESVPPYRRSS